MKTIDKEAKPRRFLLRNGTVIQENLNHPRINFNKSGFCDEYIVVSSPTEQFLVGERIILMINNNPNGYPIGGAFGTAYAYGS